MGLADIALEAGRIDRTKQDAVDIITFIESPWGLNVRLYPVQRVILKAHYGLALDDNPWNVDLTKPIPIGHPHYNEIAVLEDTPEKGYYRWRVPISNWRREGWQYFSEAGYLRKLFEDGRCNIREVVPGQQRRELVLSIGRRSGKTFLCACVVAYEVYKLLLKGCPQELYGLPTTNQIGLISVATDKDQAGLLYIEASGHFSNCAFFKPYTANNTQSYAKFQTPADIAKFGRYVEDPTAKATVKVSFKSCVAKGLRGPGNIVIILDELAHFNDVGQSDAKTIYDAVTPSIGAFSPKDPKDSRVPVGEVEGRVLCISSPLGKQGHFYTLFSQGMKGGLAAQNLLCIQAPTWEVNPTIEATFLEGKYVQDATTFFTEFGAEFTDRTRGWIEREEDLMACVNPNLRPALRAPTRAPHFAGLDISLGKADGDYCAIAIGHIEPGDLIVLDYIERIRAGEGAYLGRERIEFDEIADWVHGLSRRFYLASGIFDQYAGIPFEQALNKRGLAQLRSEFFTKPLTSQLFQNFKDMMHDKRLALFDWPLPASGVGHCAYIQELLELQAEAHSKYVVTVEAPKVPGKYDDYSDALVRMVWEASQHLTQRKYIAGRASAAARGGNGPNKPMTAIDAARAKRVAIQRSRFGGSSPDRQRSTLNRTRTRGRTR